MLYLLCVLLSASLVASLSLNAFLYNNLAHSYNHSSFHSFRWGPAEQNIVPNGTLYINMTFERVDGNLTMTVKINDDDYNVQWKEPDYLLLQFEDFKYYDYPYPVRFWLRADNRTYSEGSYMLNPELILTGIGSFHIPAKSLYHTCVFKPDEGYTFHFSFPTESSPLVNSTTGYLPFTWSRTSSGRDLSYIYPISGSVVKFRFHDCPDGLVYVNRSIYVPWFNFEAD